MSSTLTSLSASSRATAKLPGSADRSAARSAATVYTLVAATAAVRLSGVTAAKAAMIAPRAQPPPVTFVSTGCPFDSRTTLSPSVTTSVAPEVSGATDVVTDGESVVRLSNGHPVLTKVTGGGCALGAIMAAFAAVTPDSLTAAVAATSVYTVAADLAAERSALPGSFAVALLDALSEVSVDDIAARAVIA